MTSSTQWSADSEGRHDLYLVQRVTFYECKKKKKKNTLVRTFWRRYCRGTASASSHAKVPPIATCLRVMSECRGLEPLTNCIMCDSIKCDLEDLSPPARAHIWPGQCGTFSTNTSSTTMSQSTSLSVWTCRHDVHVAVLNRRRVFTVDVYNTHSHGYQTTHVQNTAPSTSV